MDWEQLVLSSRLPKQPFSDVIYSVSLGMTALYRSTKPPNCVPSHRATTAGAAPRASSGLSALHRARWDGLAIASNCQRELDRAQGGLEETRGAVSAG